MGADGADLAGPDEATGTAVAPASDVDTAFVPPELAWSAAAEIEQDDRQPWRRAWAIAALVLTAAAIVAGSVSLVGQQPLQTTVTATTVLSTVVANSPAPAPPAFTRTLTSLPAAELPPTTASAPTTTTTMAKTPGWTAADDQNFLARMRADDWAITDAGAMTYAARWFCTMLRLGNDPSVLNSKLVAIGEVNETAVLQLTSNAMLAYPGCRYGAGL